MSFGSVMLQNAGRDLYICEELADTQERSESVYKSYRLVRDRKDKGICYIVSPESGGPAFRIDVERTELLVLRRVFDMVDIEARRGCFLYHIYIRDCISLQCRKRWGEAVLSGKAGDEPEKMDKPEKGDAPQMVCIPSLSVSVI